jgi:hypothetical protein
MSLRELLRLPWRALRAVLLVLAALLLAFEEWGWRPLVAALGRIAHWPPIAWCEQRLRSASPRWALASFLAPTLLLFPFKLLALWLIHAGHAVLGLLAIVAAKLVGTALVGRIFVLTEPQLMQFAAFARALGWWRDTKHRLHAWCTASPAWRACRAVSAGLRRMFRRWRRGLG